MPELPEVENVRLSLSEMGLVGQTVERIDLRRRDLRVPFPKALSGKLQNQRIHTIQRRAKYLLFETEKYVLLSHLGMTGSWRKLQDEKLGPHDHVVVHFRSGLKLAFNDPRRFGLLDLVLKRELGGNRWLRHLGVEPLSSDFHSDYLFERTRGIKAPIKNFLMDQKHVVGVGNIYASEALFEAGIKPKRAAGRVTKMEAQLLVYSVRDVLERAIQAGGSTIRDYRNSRGESGNFQDGFAVYDRHGEPCSTCKNKIQSCFLAGRNTFWCPKCQR